MCLKNFGLSYICTWPHDQEIVNCFFFLTFNSRYCGVPRSRYFQYNDTHSPSASSVGGELAAKCLSENCPWLKKLLWPRSCPLPKKQSTPCNWSVQGYKDLILLLQYKAVLKDHPSFSVTHGIVLNYQTHFNLWIWGGNKVFKLKKKVNIHTISMHYSFYTVLDLIANILLRNLLYRLKRIIAFGFLTSKGLILQKDSSPKHVCRE